MPSTIFEQILSNVENGAVLPTAPLESDESDLLGLVDQEIERLLLTAASKAAGRSASPAWVLQQFSLALREGLFGETPTEVLARSSRQSVANLEPSPATPNQAVENTGEVELQA